MDEIKLSTLLAMHSCYDMDKLEFTRRVASDHAFNSIDDCVNYMEKMITFKNLNNDDPNGICMNSFEESPVLIINVIDEAICSMIYEINLQIYRKDLDFLAYVKHRVEELAHILANEDWPEKYAAIHSALYGMLMLISFHSSPIPHREEVLTSQLSYGYYYLMYALYSNARPRTDYFSKLTAYYNLKCHQ